MNAPAALVTDVTGAKAAERAGYHVFGEREVSTDALALAALVDAAFLAEAGWDPATLVLSLPPGHRLLGWRMCPSPGCGRQLYGRERRCGRCRRLVPARQEIPLVGTDSPEACLVAACPRRRDHNRRYCRAHYERLLDRRADQACFDELLWRAIEPAIEAPGQVSLHGIAELAACEFLYGLQQRTRGGAATAVAKLRQVAWELRRSRAASMAELPTDDREHYKLVRCFTRHVGRAFCTAEAETVKDVWDLAIFGHSGRLNFEKITQEWLREAAKRWAADDLPRRRGKDVAGPLRHYLRSLSALSESLRASRADGGTDPAVLGRADIDNFVQRMAYLAAHGRISVDARTRICREIRHLLGLFRALGLTRPGRPAAGLPEDFALTVSDVPVKPDDAEAGRDLPPEIMRQLCHHLPILEERISCREVRIAVELIIDTGRRPDEICALPWDCLEYDEPGHLPVLVYDNHKNARQKRRLPIAQATADLIIGQKQRIRERFPGTPLGELRLFPAAHANPDGRRPLTEAHLGARHRAWIAELPPLIRADGTEFDKARIVPYAYRHTYAQRHADAGVPVDVLGTLMDHRTLHTTQDYYNNPQELHRTGENAQVTWSRGRRVGFSEALVLAA